MIRRYCLALQAKSAAEYNEICYDGKTRTGLVVLPSQRRLQDCKWSIHPKQGYNYEIINEMKYKIMYFSDFSDFLWWYYLMKWKHIIWKLKKNLVWSNHTGDLIGFVDYGDVNLNYLNLWETNAIASHVQVLYFEVQLIYFNIFWLNLQLKSHSRQIFPMFWKFVAICETQYTIKVVAVSYDEASAYDKFFGMHFGLTHDDELNAGSDAVWRTIFYLLKTFYVMKINFYLLNFSTTSFT